MRDFYIAAALGFKEGNEQIGETTIRVFAPEKFSQTARSALETTAKALTVFSELYTPYPYKEFDIVAIPVEAGGIEYPGVIVVTSGLFANPFGRLGSVLVHEIAHQWLTSLADVHPIFERWIIFFGTVYILVVLFFPRGIVGFFREKVVFRKKKQAVTETQRKMVS